MEWKESKNIEANNYTLPGDWLKIKYFEAFNILFRVENSLRVFVYIILKNEFKDKWKDLSVTSDDSETSTIGAIAKKRLSQDKNYAYLGYIINSPLLHLTSGELIRIITSDSYWKYFKKYFLGTKEIIKNKLDEISNVRNSLAHFRPIKKGDVELVKQNSIHTLSEIEKTIYEFLTCEDIVPTNTSDAWYTKLLKLKTKLVNISFNQSRNEEWVKLNFSFTPSTLSLTSKYYGFELKTANIKTDKLLIDYPKLSKLLLFTTERNPFLFIKDFDEVDLSKTISFVFSNKTISLNYNEIIIELTNIINQIDEEFNLIKEDNLARGKLIEVVNCHMEKSEGGKYYTEKSNSFRTKLNEVSPVEFWGDKKYISENYITNTNNYPWMPTNISEDNDLLF